MFDDDGFTDDVRLVVSTHDLSEHFTGIEILVMIRVVLYIRM
jgi:hypothetical protein